MVNDFIPRRGPKKPEESKQIHVTSGDAGEILRLGATTKPDDTTNEASPQLTRAQPFLRPSRPHFQSMAEDEPSDDALDMDRTLLPKNPDMPPPKKSVLERTKAWWRELPKKKKIIYIVISVLVVIGLAVGGYFLLKGDTAPQKATAKKQVVKKEAAKPVITYSKLTGLPVDPAVNQRPVTGVMIENSPDARPQSGLLDAGVVFEAIAEGGITRFLALFQDAEPDYIGPVRSVRPYYIQWAAAFNASIAHVGGSPEALQSMKDWNIRDLDQFAGGSYFWRINTRYAPHNVYTSISKLREYSTKKGYTGTEYAGLAHKIAEVKPAAATAPKARIIDLAISSTLYNAHYDYDAATNTYLRKVGGAPHLDDKSSKQLSPKVVVAMVMPYSIQSDGIHSVYQTLGSGKVTIFQDGDMIEGTWHKADRNAQFTFTDAAGKEIPLNPGQAWITAVGTANAVTYAP